MISTDVIRKLSGVPVLVVGDLMLDEHVVGRATRLSPEAPVPILEVEDSRWYLGGAANVAANIASLGGEVWVVGLIGEDEDGGRLLSAARQVGRIHVECVRDPNRPTTRKSRIVAQGQQLLRVDRERRDPPEPPIRNALLTRALAILPRVKAVILSDYAKGVLDPLVLGPLLAAVGAIPCVVDPKSPFTVRYRGATVLTPNEMEACVAAGVEPGDVDGAAERLLTVHPAVLVTRGAAGMVLYRRSHAPLRVAAIAHPVFDRTGAGDTVAATLGLALGAGLPMEDGVLLATHAAGVVVGKPGTAVVTPQELEDSMRAHL